MFNMQGTQPTRPRYDKSHARQKHNLMRQIQAQVRCLTQPKDGLGRDGTIRLSTVPASKVESSTMRIFL